MENHKELAKTAKKIAAVIEKLEKLPIVYLPLNWWLSDPAHPGRHT